MHFRTTLQQSSKTATGISVPADVVECLGSGKRPAVRVTISGHTYRSTVAPTGGAFLLPISAQISGMTLILLCNGTRRPSSAIRQGPSNLIFCFRSLLIFTQKERLFWTLV
ncbi:MAG TPA: DUF1905 domain-containing protein [Ktedonobacteraceae bacterium]|nr:DUF1905 domain-containing protein [Ktedonobacteraceae bacterium]